MQYMCDICVIYVWYMCVYVCIVCVCVSYPYVPVPIISAFWLPGDPVTLSHLYPYKSYWQVKTPVFEVSSKWNVSRSSAMCCSSQDLARAAMRAMNGSCWPHDVPVLGSSLLVVARQGYENRPPPTPPLNDVQPMWAPHGSQFHVCHKATRCNLWTPWARTPLAQISSSAGRLLIVLSGREIFQEGNILPRKQTHNYDIDSRSIFANAWYIVLSNSAAAQQIFKEIWAGKESQLARQATDRAWARRIKKLKWTRRRQSMVGLLNADYT